MAAFLADENGTPQLESDFDALRAEHARDESEGETPPPWEEPPLAYLLWLMDRDRKSTGLKSIQGRIWERGYAAGELQGEIYPDVLPAFHRWKEAGLRLAIYSSGSELAQRLIFGHLPEGDLTPLFDGFFDTRVGPKTSPESYRSIASRLKIEPSEMLFLSDAPKEIEAAEQAGVEAKGIVRGEFAPEGWTSFHRDFSDL